MSDISDKQYQTEPDPLNSFVRLQRAESDIMVDIELNPNL
jgi:hypothetical protein